MTLNFNPVDNITGYKVHWYTLLKHMTTRSTGHDHSKCKGAFYKLLMLPFCLQLLNLLKKKKLLMKESELCLKEKQQHTIGFPTFQLPASTKLFYDWPITYYLWQCLYTINLLDYRIKFSSLFIHKCIISQVPDGCKVNMYFCYLERKFTFNILAVTCKRCYPSCGEHE